MRRIPKLHLTQVNRFWRNVDRSGGADACWPWTSYVKDNGYGSFGLKGREYKAHRVSYFIEYGRIDNARLVLHRCDVRSCVNPAHLFHGTPKDNSQDAVKKGRNARLFGERNGKAKLTREAVLSIRRMCKRGGVYQKDVAKRFGVSEATVSYIMNGGRWRQVTGSKR
jgi:hypothetical protein